MGRQHAKTSSGCLPELCLAVVLLAAAGCQGETEVAAGSALKSSPAGSPQELATQAPRASAQSSTHGTQTGIGGTWLARSEGHRFTLEFIVAAQALRGCVRAADGSVTAIKIGVFSGDAFLFETNNANTGWLWSGEFSSDGLHGFRENVQTGVVEAFSAQRME